MTQQDAHTTDPRGIVPCPECDNGRVFATFTYSNGDMTDVPAECPYCGGLGTALRGAVERDYA